MELFEEYYKNFDSSDFGIYYKHDHSYRVMDYALDIAKSLGLNDRDLFIAKLCGLYHDIGRFAQWRDYKTFNDLDSIDHGDLGYDIFKSEFMDKYDLSSDEKELVLNSIKYHNKKIVPVFSDRMNLFINITRDADKLDIIDTQLFKNDDSEIVIKKELLDPILNHDMCDDALIVNNSDSLLRIISWINDFNFDYSYRILMDKKIILSKVELLNNGSKEYLELKEYVIRELEKRS